jgi:hypothetical protein
MTNNSYMGTDLRGNVYWNVGSYRGIVFGPSGWVIGSISYDRTDMVGRPVVHPSGDIYFIDFDTEYVYLRRIQNVWDPEGRAAWYEANAKTTRAGTSTVNRLRIRTEPNLESDTVGHLSEGQRVTIIDQTNEPMQIGDMNDVWYKIRTEDGVEGWSYGGLIEVE